MPAHVLKVYNVSRPTPSPDVVFGKDGTPSCPRTETVCQYAPGKHMCCHAGHYCVPNVGCTCAGVDLGL